MTLLTPITKPTRLIPVHEIPLRDPLSALDVPVVAHRQRRKTGPHFHEPPVVERGPRVISGAGDGDGDGGGGGDGDGEGTVCPWAGGEDVCCVGGPGGDEPLVLMLVDLTCDEGWYGKGGEGLTAVPAWDQTRPAETCRR